MGSRGVSPLLFSHSKQITFKIISLKIIRTCLSRKQPTKIIEETCVSETNNIRPLKENHCLIKWPLLI